MEQFEAIECPFCGGTMELAIDTRFEEQCLTTDCEVCCRPFTVRARCAAGEVLSVEVDSG
jgi:hypothetical protein